MGRFLQYIFTHSVFLLRYLEILSNPWCIYLHATHAMWWVVPVWLWFAHPSRPVSGWRVIALVQLANGLWCSGHLVFCVMPFACCAHPSCAVARCRDAKIVWYTRINLCRHTLLHYDRGSFVFKFAQEYIHWNLKCHVFLLLISHESALIFIGDFSSHCLGMPIRHYLCMFLAIYANSFIIR